MTGDRVVVMAAEDATLAEMHEANAYQRGAADREREIVALANEWLAALTEKALRAPYHSGQQDILLLFIAAIERGEARPGKERP
jgi:hypothetical protein